MCEADIKRLISNYNIYLAEINVIENCVKPGTAREELLVKRIKLVDTWISLVSEVEQTVLQRHLIDGLSWSKLARENERKGITCNDRALQRAQKRALSKLYAFTENRFSKQLDYLTET